MKLLTLRPFSDNQRAALLMTAAAAGYTLNDACMKAISDAFPIGQSVFLRGIIACILFYLFAQFRGNLTLRLSKRDWSLISLRSISETVATFCFLTALFNMPIANVTAILQVLPLTIALAAWLFLNEPLGWRRLNAIVIGLLGVLLIVKPGAGFDYWSIYALLAVVCITIRDLVVRKMAPETPSLPVAFAALALITFVFGISSMFETWQPVGIREALFLGSAAGFIVFGGICAVAVMRIGEISFVAPFRYTGLIFALVIGVVFFEQFPDFWTIVGATLVVAGGIYTIYRENLKR